MVWWSSVLGSFFIYERMIHQSFLFFAPFNVVKHLWSKFLFSLYTVSKSLSKFTEQKKKPSSAQKMSEHLKLQPYLWLLKSTNTGVSFHKC